MSKQVGRGNMRRAEKLALHAQSVTLLPAKTLEKLREDHQGLVVLSGLSYALFSSRPIENLFRVAWVGRIGIVVMLPLLGLALYRVPSAGGKGEIGAFKYYRLTSLEQRDGATPSEPGVERFGLLRYGEGEADASTLSGLKPCKSSDTDGGVWEVDGVRMTLTLPDKPARDFDMWFIETLREEGTEGKDSVRFRLEASDDLREWSLVGSSTSVAYYTAVFQTEGIAATPLDRGTTLTIDSTFTFAHVFYLALVIPIYFLGVCVVIAAMLGKPLVARRLLLLGFWFQTFGRLIAAVLFAWSPAPHDREYNCGRAIVGSAATGVAMFCVHWREEVFEICIFALGIYQFLVQYWQHWQLFGEPLTLKHGQGAVPFIVAFCGAGVLFSTSRLYVMRKVIANMLPIKAQFDAAWANVLQREGDEVQHVEDLVRAIKRTTVGKSARQRNLTTKKIRKLEKLKMKMNSVVDSSLSLSLSAEAFDVSRQESSEPPIREPPILSRLLDRRFAGQGGRGSRVASTVSTSSPPGSFSMHGRPLPGAQSAQRSVTRSRVASYPSRVGSRRELDGQDFADSWQAHQYLAHNVLQNKDLVKKLGVRCESEVALGPPVETLDQLHSQAFLVQEIFFDTVVDLARVSGGKFRLKSSNETPQAADFGDWEETERDKFILGGIKKIASCIAKLDLAYNRDVSRLLDMCRETIYFESVSSLHACLAALSLDSRIEIVRIKSTLHDASTQGDARVIRGALSSGMRFVGVNIRMRVSEAQRLCVETHICELLLVLTDIGVVANAPQTQEAYRDWRKCKRVIAFFSQLLHRIKNLHRIPWFHGRQSDSTLRQPSTAGIMAQAGSTTHLVADRHPEPAEVASREAATEGSFSIKSLSRNLPGAIEDQCFGEEVCAAGTLLVISAAGNIDGDNEIQVSPGRLSMQQRNSVVSSQSRQSESSVGLHVSKEMEWLLEGIGCMSALGLGDFLDNRWDEVRRGHDQSTYSSTSFSAIFFSVQNQMVAALKRWPIKLLVVALGALDLWRGVAYYQSFEASAHWEVLPSYRHYRLETLLTRNAAEGGDIAGPGISAFGVLGESRCMAEASLFVANGQQSPDLLEPSFAEPIGSSFVTSYPSPRSMSGWYLRTGSTAGSEGQDPAYFTLWATNDDLDAGTCFVVERRVQSRWWEVDDEVSWCGARWTRVGAPSWTFEANLFGLGTENIQKNRWWTWIREPIVLPESRAQLKKFLLQPSEGYYFCNHVLCHFSAGAGSLLCIIVDMLITTKAFSALPAAHWFLTGGYVISSLFLLASSCIAFNQLGISVWALLPLQTGATMLLLVTTYNSSRALIFFLWGVFGFLVLSFACNWWMNRSIFSPNTPIVGFGMAVLAILIMLHRTKSLWGTKRLLKVDQTTYNQLWETLISDQDNIAGIEHLEKVVRMIGLDDIEPCRQRNRVLVERLPPPVRAKFMSQMTPEKMAKVHPILREIGKWSIPERPDEKSQVASTNQLYFQAAIANLLLIERLKAWASRTSGMFMCMEGDSRQFHEWNEIKADPQKLSTIQWPSMKGHDRVIEKLARSYGNNPSKLVDVARSSIVFRSMAHLTNCLGNMVTDENVRVERIKNRLNLTYDSEETWGYRDVCVNLKMTSKEAQALGVELHVCEVQLILHEFAQVKAIGRGHGRYVNARNATGN